MDQSAFMDNLRQLFSECDRDQSGSLGPDEFKELCSKIGLSREMADETFKRLDIDQNSQITFAEFAAGFNQYKQQQQAQPKPLPPATEPKRAPAASRVVASQVGATQPQPSQRLSPSPVSIRARSRASPSGGAPTAVAPSLGSTGSSSNLTASGRSTSSGGGFVSAAQLGDSNDPCSSYEQGSGADPIRTQAPDDVVVYSSDLIDTDCATDQASGSGQFGSIMSSTSSYSQVKTMQDLLECVQKLQNENQILTQIFFKDKREREEYISQLGEEFDQQLREVEERANRRAKEELETEKKRLREMMQTERETLQYHYQTLEKISKMVKSSSNGKSEDGEGFSKVKSQLEDTFMENRQLKKSLLDTKTDVALIWKEMEKLKKQYEVKLSSAYEKQRETQHECDHIKLQLNLMKDSNRKLQDASDVITNYITDKVEPVIKVAMDGQDEACESNGSLRLSGSASNSRKGSILSEYINNNNDDDVDTARNAGGQSGADLESMASSLASHPQQAKAKSANSSQVSTLKLLHMNGLENSLSHNERFNQSTSSCSTNTSDNYLSVPSSSSRQANQHQRNDHPDKPTVKNPRMPGEHHKDSTAPKTKPEDDEQNIPEPATRTSLKNLGRLLGNRTQSDAKPTKETATSAVVTLADIKSISADHADDPIVEPADGPSKATFNIILVGDSFVGKSSFAARFIEGSFVQGLISNCSIDFKTKSYKVDGSNYTVNLWDTA